MKQPCWWTPFALAMSLPLVATASESERAVAEIQALQQQQADAWNAHDARAYAALFVEDGDVVNVMGWWWRGRAEIERNLRQAFVHTFAASRLEIVDTTVRVLHGELAIAHVRWTMDGARAPPGAPEPPRQGIQLQVVRREAGQWRIVSFQNTNSLPEMAFPASPSRTDDAAPPPSRR